MANGEGVVMLLDEGQTVPGTNCPTCSRALTVDVEHPWSGSIGPYDTFPTTRFYKVSCQDCERSYIWSEEDGILTSDDSRDARYATRSDKGA